VLCVVHPFYQNLCHFLRISSQLLLTIQVAYIAYVSSGDWFIASQFFVVCSFGTVKQCFQVVQSNLVAMGPTRTINRDNRD